MSDKPADAGSIYTYVVIIACSLVLGMLVGTLIEKSAACHIHARRAIQKSADVNRILSLPGATDGEKEAALRLLFSGEER